MSGPGIEFIDDNEIKRVCNSLKEKKMSRYLYDEKDQLIESNVNLFEKKFCQYLKVNYAIGMNSCTSSLFSGLLGLGIETGDEIIVPGYTFIATVAAIVYAGAIPVFAEIDESLTIDTEDLKSKISKKTKAVIVVHMLGASANMSEIETICRERKIVLIEDVAQAAGAEYENKKIGSFGDFSVFSLNHFKTFTAGDGGVFSTNNHELYKKTFSIHDHGSEPLRLGISDNGLFLGLNFRMHELTGGVALEQLMKIDNILKKTREIKAKFIDCIGKIEKAKRRKIYNENGECANAIVFIFESESFAKKLASKLNSKVLIDSNKHFCENVNQLLDLKLPKSIKNGLGKECININLPQSRSILKRAIALSVGVYDPYLGPSYGVNVNSSMLEIEKKANYFKKLVLEI